MWEKVSEESRRRRLFILDQSACLREMYLIAAICLWSSAHAILVVQVHYDALYVPLLSSTFLQNVSLPNQTSTKTCIWTCTNHQYCQTAIYFYQSHVCSMFFELCSVGTIQSSAQSRAHVICYQQPPVLQVTTMDPPKIEAKTFYLPTEFYASNISTCATWNQTGITVAGHANGSAGSDLTSLNFPTCLFIDNNGSLFISDQLNSRIMKYRVNDTVGTIVAQNFIDGNTQYVLSYPRGVALDLYGFVIVTTDSPSYRILNYSNHSYAVSIVNSHMNSQIGTLRDLHIDDQNNVYVCDSDNNRVVKVMSNGSIELISFVSYGPNTRSLSQPYGSFIDFNQNWYIAEVGSSRLSIWFNGTLVATSHGSVINIPRAVVVNKNGDVFMTDLGGGGRIMKSTGNSFTNLTCVAGCNGSTGNGPNQFNSPRDLKFDRYGNLYVVDQNNNRIQKFLIQSPSFCP